MIAVNGYDEPREVVQQFVDKEKLKQPVLLMGSKVAMDIYGVEGYPTSFWIDHEGKIIHREMGFSPEMAPGMEKRIEKLLARRSSTPEKPEK